MTSLQQRDEEVMTLMAAAMNLSPDERSAYLHGACEGDETLLREIRDGLEWEERMGGFLRKPWMSLPELERPFKPGQVVNNRFEIVREIGEGGMGVVYEAFDRKRGQRIAIKSAKLGFRRLLSPELESALKVRHRNICLVNEIHTAATEYGEIDFLTMELLEGTTLQARLASGRIEPQETLEIARQLCAGLAEAHRIGIIHKDLKSANVILCRLPDGTTRAVITDFGLAGESSLESADLAGTPRYMAPELWRGAPASTASDIYALGVILYEMVTGEKPFADAPSQRLLTPRPPPNIRGRSIDKRWETAVVKCLNASPAARPYDAKEVLRFLESRAVPKKSLAVAAAVLLVAGIAGRGPLINFLKPPSIRLAILPIEGTDVNAIGDGALLDVTDRLGRRSGAPTVVVIPPSRSLAVGVHTTNQARQVLGATHALQVSLRRQGRDIVVRGAVIDLGTQTRLQEISGRFALANFGELPTALTGAVTKALHLRGVAPEPISAAAAGAYLQGLGFLRRDQHSFEAAIPLFQRAIALDAHSPLPKAGLAEALVLKYGDTRDVQLIAEADRTLRSAETLNPDSVAVLLAKGRLEAANGHYEAALNCYRRVAEIQPRNLEVTLRIADIDDHLDHREDAIRSYQEAIALDPGYYETYEEFGVFFFHRGEYSPAADQFRKVIQIAPKFYNAHTNLGAALNLMGQDDAAADALETSLKLKKTARALNSLGALRAFQKRDADALPLYAASLSLEPNSYIYLINAGDSSRRLGLARESTSYYQMGNDAALTQLKTNPRKASTRAYVASFAAHLGDCRRAEEEIEQALELSPADDTVIGRAVLTFELLGERDRAIEIASTATADILRELDRHPDLADFRQDPRFRELKAKNKEEVNGLWQTTT